MNHYISSTTKARVSSHRGLIISRTLVSAQKVLITYIIK